MGYSKLIGLENPASHRLIENSIFDVTPLYPARTFIPWKNASTKPDAGIITVQFDTSDFHKAIYGTRGNHDENQNSRQSGAMKNGGIDAQRYEGH
jgi:hypothetical protein